MFLKVDKWVFRMADETYEIGGDDSGQMGREEEDDFFYGQIIGLLSNGDIHIGIKDSPYAMLNKHTTGEKTGHTRTICFTPSTYRKIFPGDTKRIALGNIVRGNVEGLCKLLEETGKSSLSNKIKESKIAGYQPTADLEYLAELEDGS